MSLAIIIITIAIITIIRKRVGRKAKLYFIGLVISFQWEPRKSNENFSNFHFFFFALL